LKTLKLVSCKSLKSDDVKDIGLSSLETLDLRHSNWENCRALFSAELPSLKTLKLEYCKSLKSDDIEEIGLSSLETLNLSYSNWENCRALFSAELPSLKTLELEYCESLKSDDIEEIGLSSLEVLVVRFREGGGRKKADWAVLFAARDNRPKIDCFKSV